jgi:hypothetical protein
MPSNLQALVESKSKELIEARRGLVSRWDKYIGAVDSLVQERDKTSLTEAQKSVIAQCLENALQDASSKSGHRLLETTYQNDINFLGIQLPSWA